MSGRNIPALDGLRALAIAAVLVYHLGFGWATGGYLGVDLFFVLSGFLITSLLLERRLRSGSVGLRDFWGRRARRLLPGLLVMLVVVVAFVSLESAGLPIDWHQLRVQALATVGYVANWQLLWSHQSYFDRFALPSPLRHTWSLAIEEQFYLCWPLVVALIVGGAGTRRHRSHWRPLGLWVSVVGAVASATWMAVLFTSGGSVDRIYYGTDTRAFDLLAGAALAFATAGRRVPSARAQRAFDRSAAAGLVALVAVCAFAGTAVGLPRAWMFEGGFVLAVVASVLLLASLRSQPSTLLARALSLRPSCTWAGSPTASTCGTGR
jgi:peptidoglycan/LPS O-acetylase OafA/YrhL